MSGLDALWLISLVMAALSFAIIIALLIARYISGYLAPKREAGRRKLVPLLLSPNCDPAILRLRSWRGRRLATSVSVELIQLLVGAERERLVANATVLGVPERLRHQLDSGSARVRLAATEALAQFDDEKSQHRLRLALEDHSPEVRLAAAISLAAVGEPPAAAELVYKLGIGTKENSLVAVSLFRDVAKRRPEELKALLADDGVPIGSKTAVIESLSASSDYTLVPLIVSLALEEEDPRQLTRYFAALGKFGHPAARPAIARGLDCAEWPVRAAAAEAAGRIGLTSLSANLEECLADSSWWVRFRAGEALAQLGPSGHETLRRAASHGDHTARRAAAMTLAERGIT